MSAMNVPASTSGPVASNSSPSIGPIRSGPSSRSRVRFSGFGPVRKELRSSGASQPTTTDASTQTPPNIIEWYDEVIEQRDRMLENTRRELLYVRSKWEKLIKKCESLLDSDDSEDESG